MPIAFPYQIDLRGQTALTSSNDEHVQDLIEQVLFTNPSERVNRPTFGSGLRGLVFAPTNDALAAAVRHAVQGALQQWLGALIQVEAVAINVQDSTVQVTVQYVLQSNQQRQTAQFSRGF
jgi:phage baseplate assembly protein W